MIHLLLALFLALCPGRASAQPSQPQPSQPQPSQPQPSQLQTSQELTAQARAAEREGRPADEAQACAALMSLGEGGRGEQACLERLAWLEQRRDPDGGLAGLQSLEAARRETEPTRRRLLLGGLVGDPDLAQAVRAEAAASLASAAVDRGEATAALTFVEPFWPGEGLPDSTRRRVARSLAAALVAQGRTEEALAVEAALAAPGGSAVDKLSAKARQRQLTVVGFAVAAAWAVVALPLAVVGWRRGPRTVGLLPIAVSGGGGLLLAALWEGNVAAPFGLLLAALVGSHLLAAGGAAALAERSGWRALFGAASAVGTVGLGLALCAVLGLLPWMGL